MTESMNGFSFIKSGCESSHVGSVRETLRITYDGISDRVIHFFT